MKEQQEPFSAKEMANLIRQDQMDDAVQYWVDHKDTSPEPSELSLELNNELRGSGYTTHITTETDCQDNSCESVDYLNIYHGTHLAKSIAVSQRNS
jgi:hypothetical protein